jgi:hypothetical protein
MFEMFYPLMQLGVQSAVSQMGRRADASIAFDAALFPPTQSISRHLRPSVTTIARTKTGLEFTGRQTLPGNSAGVTTPTMVALLLPAVQAAREAARRNGSLNNLRQLTLAIHNHEATHGKLPAQAAYKTKDGKPGLSWRVALLPYLEEGALFEEFHLDEPWDSEHNKRLIGRMPATLRSPKSVAEPGMTTYQAVVGDDTVIAQGTEPNRFANIRDGLSNTIMFIETSDDEAVIWTKPDDFEYDEMKPTKGLGAVWSGNVFMAAYADGHVRAISLAVDPKALAAMFTKSGGEVVREDELDGAPPRVEEFEFREEAIPDEVIPEGFDAPIPVP